MIYLSTFTWSSKKTMNVVSLTPDTCTENLSCLVGSEQTSLVARYGLEQESSRFFTCIYCVLLFFWSVGSNTVLYEVTHTFTTVPVCLGQHKQTGLLVLHTKGEIYGGGTKVWVEEAGKEQALHHLGWLDSGSPPPTTNCFVLKPKWTLVSQTVTGEITFCLFCYSARMSHRKKFLRQLA